MKLALPPILESKLSDFRAQVRSVKLTEALLAALSGIALSYLIIFVADRFTETPLAVRCIICLLGATTAVIGIPLKWYRWVWKQRRLEDAARLLRRTFPRLGDQLLGIVELARGNGLPTGHSDRLVRAAMEQAAEVVKDRDFRNAVPESTHTQWALRTLFIALLCAGAWIYSSDAARNALVRWAMPWKDSERFTFTRLNPLPPRLVVPISEPFSLPLQPSADSLRTPESAHARIPRQPAVHATLDSGVYPLAFPPQKTATSLSLAVGDFRRTLQVVPLPRPELTALSVRLRLPAYLKYANEPVQEVRGTNLPLLKGTLAAFEAATDHPLASATLDEKPLEVSHTSLKTPYLAISGDLSPRLDWKDVEGLTPRDPLTLRIRAVEDEPPRITAKRSSEEPVVLESEVLTFDIETTDDFGVQRVGLEWRSLGGSDDSKTFTGSKVTASGQPERKELAARATLSPLRERIAPQSLEVRAWVEDYLPGRPRTYSGAFIIQIVTKTEHALWVVEQMSKWLDAAREGYDREQQLHQNNVELRKLDATELDRPENRRRLAQQAAAEAANSARLNALADLGKRLLSQASRNDEFDAKRIESWASTLGALDDIAAKRMPSVTDLLKQAANAAAQAANAKPAAGAESGPPDNAASGKPADPSSSGSPQDPSTAKPGGADGKSTPNDAPIVKAPGSEPKPAAADTASKPKSPDTPPSPTITNNESGLNPGAPPPSQPANTAANASKPPPLGLPQTTLENVPKKDAYLDDPSAESPAGQALNEAVKEQKALLDEFSKVAADLQKVLSGLETSTFVKRLKSASRVQMNIAKTVTSDLLKSFGIENAPPPEAAPIVETAGKQADFFQNIHSDMEAFVVRRQDSALVKVFDQIKGMNVVQQLNHNRDRIRENLSGRSIAGAEFWADTFDRWAEELVEATKNKKEEKKKPSEDKPSLPPEVILKLMQALDSEVKLRDQTREIESSKPDLGPVRHAAEAGSLAMEQDAINVLTTSAVRDITALPNALADFTKEINLVNKVVSVMQENTGILAGRDTGPAAIAAETEIIELLLQSKRAGGGGGGGGGGSGSAGGGLGPEFFSQSPLSILGSANGKPPSAPRAVGQATGVAGKEFPAEYKSGLDGYFSRLEGRSK
jgi:hypothetical protein